MYIIAQSKRKSIRQRAQPRELSIEVTTAPDTFQAPFRNRDNESRVVATRIYQRASVRKKLHICVPGRGERLSASVPLPKHTTVGVRQTHVIETRQTGAIGEVEAKPRQRWTTGRNRQGEPAPATPGGRPDSLRITFVEVRARLSPEKLRFDYDVRSAACQLDPRQRGGDFGAIRTYQRVLKIGLAVHHKLPPPGIDLESSG